MELLQRSAMSVEEKDLGPSMLTENRPDFRSCVETRYVILRAVISLEDCIFRDSPPAQRVSKIQPVNINSFSFATFGRRRSCSKSRRPRHSRTRGQRNSSPERSSQGVQEPPPIQGINRSAGKQRLDSPTQSNLLRSGRSSSSQARKFTSAERRGAVHRCHFRPKLHHLLLDAESTPLD
jgi:hypothetical protein